MQHSPRKFWEVWGRSDALYNRWAAAHGVNNYRLFVLYVLDNHPGATQKAIADHAGLPKQTVNTVVRAARRGLRHAQPRQRRPAREERFPHARRTDLRPRAARAALCTRGHRLCPHG